tara:strand:- start:313 stop:909 length:597 start_codon:yes stop_codon:yes gene_type:complete
MESDFDLLKKDILINASFSADVRPPYREYLLDAAIEHLWLDIDTTCNSSDLPLPKVTEQGVEGCKKYAEVLVRSKFSVCPISRYKVDTTRFWDALSVGSIPIVVTGPLDITGKHNTNAYKTSKFLTHVADLYIPFLAVDFGTFKGLTTEDLEEVWEDFKGADWNFDCLTYQYWLDDMQSFIDSTEYDDVDFEVESEGI